ncbi:MAG: terminase [Caldiserica bacterium]|nr:terminase [Caldisericota bacterium]
MNAKAGNMDFRQLFSRSLDPVLLAKDCNLEPDDWQAKVLRSRAKQIMLLCSRQSGKSTISAFLAIHESIYRRKTLCLLLSPSLRQSQELFKRVLGIYRMLGDYQKPAIESESALRMELSNGSRIVSLPENEDTIRGFSGVNLLVIDEAAFVSDQLYHAVRPMLAVSGGRLVALSTPHGKRGWFFDAWTKGDDWEKYQVTADQCPRISREFLESEKKAMPGWVFEQEYMCQFKETLDAVFAHDLISQAVSSEVKPLNLFRKEK